MVLRFFCPSFFRPQGRKNEGQRVKIRGLRKSYLGSFEAQS